MRLRLLLLRSAWLACVGSICGVGARAQNLPLEPAPDARMYRASHWVQFDSDSGLPGRDVHDVVEASNGRVWAATSGGVAVYDGFEWRAMTERDGLPEHRARKLLAGPRGSVYVLYGEATFVGDESGFAPLELAGGGGLLGVAVLEDERAMAVTRETATSEWRVRLEASAEDVGPPGTLGPNGLAQHAPGTATCMATDEGIYRYEAEQWTLLATLPPGLMPLQVEASADGSSGVFFANRPLDNRGLWEWLVDGTCRPAVTGYGRVFDLHLGAGGDVLAVYRSGRIATRRAGWWSEIDPLPREMVGANRLGTRGRGELWCSSANGLFLFRPHHPYWSGVALDGARSETVVLQALEVGSGEESELFLGTSQGLMRVSPEGVAHRISTLGGRDLGAITGIARDGRGALWIGSGSASFAGAWRLDDSGWKQFDADEGLDTLALHRIRVDRRGRPWFLGIAPDRIEDEPGAFVLEGDTMQPWGTEQGLIHNRVYDFVDTGDAYWFATAGGISRWRAGAWKHWTTDDRLGSNRVYALAADAQGRVWFGHGSGRGGLGFIDGDTPRYFHRGQGPRLEVSVLGFDETGRLWVGSETDGLFSLDAGEWVEYGLAKGLTSQRISSMTVGATGVLVGTFAGDLQTLSRTPISFRVPRVLSEQALVDWRHAVLRWRVATHWRTMDPATVQVRHRIDGGAWSPWGLDRELRTGRLDYGDHTFELEVRDFFGRPTSCGPPQPFVVPTPMHRRPVFYVPLGVLLAVSAATSVVLLLRSRREKSALRESEERFRQLAENIREVFWLVDWRTRRLLYVSPAYEVVWDLPEGDLVARSDAWAGKIHAEDREHILASFEAAGEGRYDVEYRIVGADGGIRWVHDRAYPIRDDSGEVYRIAGLTEDVTAEHLGGERQRLLMRELDHRVKNNLAGVIGLAQQALARSTDLDSFDVAFTDRLHAMARTHEALAAAHWEALSLRDILFSVISPYAGPERVTIEGEALFVNAASAMPLSAALHELATNAVKYGSLSKDSGRLHVHWEQVRGRIRLRWTERDGPRVSEPRERGLGTSLVTGLVEYELAGVVTFEFAPTGLECNFELPADTRHPGAGSELGSTFRGGASKPGAEPTPAPRGGGQRTS
ncbi:MAG: PAS domain-containing protein [bacterium]|nr:PAS domain-containing protein [bacterium]